MEDLHSQPAAAYRGHPPVEVMTGYPPPAESRVTPDNWFKLPYLRWSLMNRSLSVPTVDVWRGAGPVSALPAGPALPEDVRVTGLDGEPTPLLDHLRALEVDGLLVMHDGAIVFERYFHGMRPQMRHGTASVSKSFLGVVAGVLAHQGVLDFSRQASYYVPEMRGAAMGGATLQQLLDMQAGIVRPSLDGRPGNLGPQDGGVYEILGLLPRRPGAPDNFYDFVLQKPASGEHGQKLYYDNGPPEALAWAIRRATGRPIAELLSELVYQPLGPERDAYYSVDPTGAEFTAGGLAMTMRDMARFGELLRNEGTWNGKQVVPQSFIDDLHHGGNRAFHAESRFAAANPGGAYRNYFHADGGRWQGLCAHGRYGQRIYASTKAKLVVAQFGAAPGTSPHPFEAPIARLHAELAQLLNG
ncbi:serine hydrolase [Pigmentiphaga daeguensis]|uniref:Serine hydrolase n=1 Tax=Pigmentiphaga daeguensis TaxID=414049 RepID=A0ABN1CB39_9BURK